MSDTITRILVPTDFSSYSQAALDYAARLAGPLGAAIELLHVVDDPVLSGAWSPDVFIHDAASLREDLAADARRRLDALAQPIARRGIPTRTVVLTGQPVPTIVEHASTQESDLIVMGTHGRTGLSHALVGSVTERVLRLAPCAVLSVKDVAARDPHVGQLHLATVIV